MVQLILQLRDFLKLERGKGEEGVDGIYILI